MTEEDQAKLLTEMSTRQKVFLEQYALDRKTFVTHAEFWPVKTIVYSGAGIVLLAVGGAIVNAVVRS